MSEAVNTNQHPKYQGRVEYETPDIKTRNFHHYEIMAMSNSAEPMNTLSSILSSAGDVIAEEIQLVVGVNEKTDSESENQEETIESQKSKAIYKPVQLKLWPAEIRAAPNALLRSALFGLIEKGKRKALKEESLACWAGGELKYTGWQLDQNDEDVFLQTFQEARGRLGYRVVLNHTRMLRAIGRSNSGKNIKWLRSSLSRMKATDVSLKIGDFVFHESLIERFAENEVTGDYEIHLSPQLAKLFEDGTTYIEIEQRKQLKGMLSKWLQGYICSHHATKGKPHRIGIDKLRHLCGSKTKRLRDFKRKLGIAMNELKSVGVVIEWRIVDGKESPVLEFARPEKTKSLDTETK